MRCYIGIVVPEPLSSELEVIRLELNAAPLNSPLHLTLVPPGEVFYAKAIDEVLRRNTRGVRSFPVSINSAGQFENNVHLVVDQTEGLMAVQQVVQHAVSRFLPRPKKAREFRPHITMDKFKDGEEQRQELVLAQLGQRNIQDGFLCSHIALMVNIEGSYQTIESFPLVEIGR